MLFYFNKSDFSVVIRNIQNTSLTVFARRLLNIEGYSLLSLKSILVSLILRKKCTISTTLSVGHMRVKIYGLPSFQETVIAI